MCTLHDNCAWVAAHSLVWCFVPSWLTFCSARAVYDLTPYNKAVLAINFITLFYYLFVQTFLGCAHSRSRLTACSAPLTACRHVQLSRVLVHPEVR